MTLNMCGCINKLCKTKLLKKVIRFQCPGVMLIQMKIKITKENVIIKCISTQIICYSKIMLYIVVGI